METAFFSRRDIQCVDMVSFSIIVIPKVGFRAPWGASEALQGGPQESSAKQLHLILFLFLL